ncbi:unnamed protein product [Paramecium primaurelia]|uniref:Uncharacterized protein n=1 Tax=Paramecium primaurelia TaxID=5886 RepID=A0A8S1ND92_PARPR|nr:unnamed protein product [Paramecium primaurelia]
MLSNKSIFKDLNSNSDSPFWIKQYQRKAQGWQFSLRRKIIGQNENANSKERMKRWPTTIAAYKQKRDQHRFEKFTAVEEERRQIDIEEEIFQKGQKKITLEQANKQIYEDSDRLKFFMKKCYFLMFCRRGMNKLQWRNIRKNFLNNKKRYINKFQKSNQMNMINNRV